MPQLLSPAEQASLVERLGSGDADAEAEFARLFWGRLRIMFSARLGDREVAQDLAQEALLAALVELRRGSLRDGERLAAFVYGIGRNVANNHLRRQRAAPAHVAIEPDTVADPRPADDLDEQERLRLATTALRTLPAQEREILGLTLVEGLKPGEIASRLGKHVDVIRTRKSRALKKVVAEIERMSRFGLSRH
jgi:RNA polymerase sigma-70 factor (ECF subfamily)